MEVEKILKDLYARRAPIDEAIRGAAREKAEESKR